MDELSKQNIEFIIKTSVDRKTLINKIKELQKISCSVNPCQHRSPPGIGGESYYKEQNMRLMNLLLDIVNDEFDHMEALKLYIKKYML